MVERVKFSEVSGTYDGSDEVKGGNCSDVTDPIVSAVMPYFDKISSIVGRLGSDVVVEVVREGSASGEAEEA